MIIENEEVFFVEYEKDPSKCLLYAPLRSYLGLIDNRSKTRFLDGDPVIKDAILGKLKSRLYIDIKKLHESFQNQSPELAIAITDDCNLKCRYCHASAGEIHKQNSLDRTLLYQVLEDFISSFDAKEARISFAGGGEPTYDLNNLKFAIDTAKGFAVDKGILCSFSMGTNGNYKQATRDYIKNTFQDVSLSFDGPEFIHDMHRPLKNGKGSFKIVYETAKDFYESSLSFGFRATISNYSLGYVREIVDFFADNFPNKILALEALNPFGRGKSDELLSPPTKNEFVSFLLEAYKYAQNKPIRLANAGLGKFKILRTFFCSAVGTPNLTVCTDGSISCCTRDNAPDVFSIGIFDRKSGEFVLDNNKIARLKHMNVFHYDECVDCFCKYHCAGDCPDLRISNLHNCEANRKIGTFILNDKINNETI